MTCTQMQNTIVCHSEKYKPGDMPPAGYLDWHEWAKVQYRAGLRQVACGLCGKVKFPQELSDKTIEGRYRKTKHGDEFIRVWPVCLQCEIAREGLKP